MMAKKVFSCVVCDKWADSSTKHCAACNKCVKGFDHHCLWLNNCIGSNNYRKFFILICVYLVHGIFSLNLGVSVHYMEQEEEGYASDLHALRVCLSVLLIMLEAVRIFAALALVLWHIYLHKIGITTYQFLVEKEELEKLKLKLI